MTDTSTQEGRQKRIGEIIKGHAEKSTYRGDAHALLAQSWGAPLDFEPIDNGSHPDERYN
jgi:hypothetical protein